MKKGLRRLIAGIVLIILAVFVIPLSIFLPQIFKIVQSTPFLVPGSIDIEVEQAGRYYLWNDFRTVFEGKTYNTTAQMPHGMEIRVTDADGNVLPFSSDQMVTMSFGAATRQSIGFVEVPSPGEFKISVLGDEPQQVFSYSRFNTREMMVAFFKIFAGCGVLFLAGVGLTAWGIIKMTNKQPQQIQGNCS